MGWGGRVKGGKYKSFFFVIFQAHKAETAEKLRGAVLVSAKWVPSHRGCQDIIIKFKCRAVSVASKTI